VKVRWPGLPLLLSLVLVTGLAAAGPASGQTTEPDSLDAAVADADSAAGPTSLSEIAAQAQQQGQQADQQTDAEGPFLVSWDRLPKAGISAKVRKVRYYGELGSNLKLLKGATITKMFKYATETYRKQDKTTETRDGTLSFRDGSLLPFSTDLNLDLSWNWLEDHTVNSAGTANLNKNDNRQASLTLNRQDIQTAFLKHDLRAMGQLKKQQGESQRKRIDSSEGSFSGGLRSSLQPVTGVSVATSVYGKFSEGERVLGETTSPSSTNADSLGAGLFYKRGLVTGFFEVKRSSFEKRFLDYNRDANGLVDTSDAGIDKIVQELERMDAISLVWENRFRLGPVTLSCDLARDMDEHTYRASGLGRQEKYQDQTEVDLAYNYGQRDSVSVAFGYLFKWDDQTYKGATAARGRQMNQRRDVTLTWGHRLFRHTTFLAKFNNGLSQDMAEDQFNDNDRDRLETFASAKLTADWPTRFKASMLFSYRHVEDLSIRQSRSANNNFKDTYEISPGYAWPVGSIIQLQQSYTISIQYTDYIYSDLDVVNRQDDYNKRGNLNTQVSLNPSPDLRLTVSHDYNEKFNASRLATDVTGHDYYHRDQEQRISRIDFAVNYRVSPWFTVQGASFQTKDVRDTFGTTTTTLDRRSGEIWVGCSIDKKWGPTNDALHLQANVRRYNAFGPNIQETNARYWDADVSLSWKF